MLKHPQYAATAPTMRGETSRPPTVTDLKLPAVLQGETMWYKPIDEDDDDLANFEAAFARLTGIHASE